MGAPGVDDVVSGAVQWLRADSAVTALLATGMDGLPLVVQDNAPDRAEYAQAVCAVITHAGPEASAEGSTWEWVRLQVEFWSDPLRDAHDVVDEAPAGARKRMTRAAFAVDRRLNRPGNDSQWWGDLRTIGCARRSGLNPYLVPGGDGLWRGTAMYAVALG